jgi:hypothetical protein
MIIILALLTGFRNMGGTDFFVYMSVYNEVPMFNIKEVLIFSQLRGWESGYLLYISFIKTYLGLSFYGYIVLQSIIIYTLLYVGLKKYTAHWGIFMLLFMYKMFFYDTFVSMRQPIAIVIFFTIMHFIQEKKWIKYYVILTLLILPFHNSTYVLFLVYFVSFFKITKQRIVLLGCIFIPLTAVPELGINPLQILNPLIDNVSADAIAGRAEGYLAHEQKLGILFTLEYMLMLFLLIINYDKVVKSHKYAPLIIKLFLIILPIVTLFRGTIILTRVMSFFIPTYAFILGYICDVNKSKKWIIIIGVAIVCLYGYLRQAYFFSEGDLLPYRSWLNVPNVSMFN